MSTATTIRAMEPGRVRGRLTVNAVLAVAVALILSYTLLWSRPSASHADQHVPQSVAMEQATGVRFSRVAVVGDKGLVTVSYVVLDTEKATAFQADRDHPPRIQSESREGGTRRASIMRAGHAMRAGQTYFLLYENTAGAIRSGEQVTIVYGGRQLRHVPVL